MGIEPTSEAWEASILPLYDARSFLSFVDYTQPSECRYSAAETHASPRETGAWMPRAVVRLDLTDRRITRISDYLHCPWILQAATSVVVGQSSPN